MGLEFKGSTIFLDTAPLIYYFKGASAMAGAVDNLFIQKDESGGQFLTSTITISEILQHPFRQDAIKLAAKYHLMLSYSRGLKICKIDQPVAERAAQVRASYQVNATSALQLATAIVHEADLFLTHDLRLKAVKEVPIITLQDLVS